MSARTPRFVLMACSRCCGDLCRESDRWGGRYVCLQCGGEETGAPYEPRNMEALGYGVSQEAIQHGRPMLALGRQG